MVGFLFGQDGLLPQPQGCGESTASVWATGDIRAKLWLEGPGQPTECSRKRPLLPGILFQSPPHLLRLPSSCTWNSAPIVLGSGVGRACAAASCSLPLTVTAPLLASALSSLVLDPPRPAQHCSRGLKQLLLVSMGS